MKKESVYPISLSILGVGLAFSFFSALTLHILFPLFLLCVLLMVCVVLLKKPLPRFLAAALTVCAVAATCVPAIIYRNEAAQKQPLFYPLKRVLFCSLINNNQMMRKCMPETLPQNVSDYDFYTFGQQFFPAPDIRPYFRLTLHADESYIAAYESSQAFRTLERSEIQFSQAECDSGKYDTTGGAYYFEPAYGRYIPSVNSALIGDLCRKGENLDHLIFCLDSSKEYREGYLFNPDTGLLYIFSAP